MPDEDLKTQVALLAQAVNTLTRTMERDQEQTARRVEKLEGYFKWATIAILGAVLTQVLRVAGIGQ